MDCLFYFGYLANTFIAEIMQTGVTAAIIAKQIEHFSSY